MDQQGWLCVAGMGFGTIVAVVFLVVSTIEIWLGHKRRMAELSRPQGPPPNGGSCGKPKPTPGSSK
jgi:hypothetical protein